MKVWLDELINEKVELQIAPLIDVVFLLLIYFMVSSTLKRSEADLSMTLPGVLPQSQEMDIPDEQIIEVLANGSIVFNGREYSSPARTDLDELGYILKRYHESSLLTGTPAMITIAADDDSLHDRVIAVLDVCAGAGIKNITFGSAE